MGNINIEIKKKQLKVFALVVTIIIVACVAFWYFEYGSKSSATTAQSKEKTVVDGVLSPTLNDAVTRSAVSENNMKTSLLEDRLNKLEEKLERKDKALIKLKSDSDKATQELNSKINQQANEINKLKGNSTVNVGGYNSNSANNYSNNQNFSNTARAIKTASINSSLLNNHDNSLPYIPSGSFAKAMIVEGADANASVTGGNSTVPMQFTLTGKIQMPNGEEYDATGCFVTAEVYGDISSERGEVRTRNISCKLNGKTVDMKFKGHVAYMGKNGIRGTAIMRNGKIIAWAGASGLLSGLGSGVQATSTTVAGIGATVKPSTNDVISGALGGAFEKSASTLSEYYIKRAEQYHPIIEINANNEVTVMFQEGFQLSYIETEKSINSKDLIAKGRDSAIEQGHDYISNAEYNFGGGDKPFSFENLTKKIVE